jgi:hypothetical protein
MMVLDKCSGTIDGILIQMHSQQQAVVLHAVNITEKEASFCCCISRKSNTRATMDSICLYNTQEQGEEDLQKTKLNLDEKEWRQKETCEVEQHTIRTMHAAIGDRICVKHQNVLRIGYINPTGFMMRSGTAKDSKNDSEEEKIEASDVEPPMEKIHGFHV